MNKPIIPGYTFGTDQVAKSPVTAAEFELLKQAVFFPEEDWRYLRLAGTVLEDQIEAVLDVWYNFVGFQPHLAHYFSSPEGQLNGPSLTAVRPRFGQWIKDTCKACYDQAWLDYQQKIAVRGTPTEKNQTDKVSSAPDPILPRYLIRFKYPITAIVKPFMCSKGHSAGEVETMSQAWFKAVVLQVSLWSAPYARAEMF